MRTPSVVVGGPSAPQEGGPGSSTDANQGVGQGPVPGVLRLPELALTHNADNEHYVSSYWRAGRTPAQTAVPGRSPQPRTMPVSCAFSRAAWRVMWTRFRSGGISIGRILSSILIRLWTCAALVA